MASASSSGKSRGKRRAGQTLIKSYARIKPMAADKDGGVAAGKGIRGYDADEGVVEIGAEGGSKTKRYTHFHATIPPEADQEGVYATVCAPFVSSWLDGYDVDLICYGQTGSGKTHTMFGPPHAMARAADSLGGSGGEGTISPDGVITADHGFILRAGFEALRAVESINSSGGQAVLHGSMVEMSILSFTDQTVLDLLNKNKPCYLDKTHHIQGAKHVPLTCTRDLVMLAAAVETRTTRGTRMNDTSSRSHCITIFSLHELDAANERVRESRFQFFDLMGSERFKGANAAHDTSVSSKATMGGWEGIFANLSLSSLMESVRSAAVARRKGTKMLQAGLNTVLNDTLSGSLKGSALTGMITCISQHPRNGAETALSVQYSSDMAKLLNAAVPQPQRPFLGSC